MPNIGPHLLGRYPSPPDTRDHKMADELARRAADASFDQYLDGSVRDMLNSGSLSTWKKLLGFWRWLKAWFANPTPTPPSPPTPTPVPTPTPATKTEWADLVQLDQGNTGHCVGFGNTALLNADPVSHNFDDAYAHAVYYACKVVDGEPGQEDGSYVRSGGKVLKNRGLISNYVFAATVDEIKQWVLNHGPVVMGTDWDNDMFNPDANGFVRLGGGIAGGHCFLMVGYDEATDVFEFDNSWGTGWGVGGRFFMHGTDFTKLFARSGSEAMAATEVA